jgi:hypothetical protein
MHELKRMAVETHRTMASIIEDAIREVLARRRSKPARKPVKLPTFKGGTGVRPGIDLNNSASLWDAMDGL